MVRVMDEVVVHERRRGKPWYESKTIWANLISALVAIILLVSQSPSLAPYAEWLMLTQGVLNIVLRVVTNQGVTT